MMDIRDSLSKEAGKDLSTKKSDDTKKMFSYLLLTAKNVSLYPEGHGISMNSIRQFHVKLEDYIRQNGDIRIEFERNRVMCQGIEVQTGQSEEGSLPFTLFRDGIEWLEFNEGIELEEIQEVLSIIRRYSILATEPEGDIVTAFWEAHFDHVQYKVSDFFSEQVSDQIDRFSESATRPPAAEDKTASPEVSADNDPALFGDLAIYSSSINNDTFIDPASLVLTPHEQIELQEMIARDEMSSSTEHLDMLLDMLLQCQEEKDFNIVLEVLSEEFAGSFDRYDLEAVLIILDGVRRVLDSGRLCQPWAGPLVESFYNDISSDTKCLKPLEGIWSNLNVAQIEKLKLIFQHLNPGAVNTLVCLLLLGQPSQLEQIVEDTIISLVYKDLNCLESLLNDPNEKITETLVHVLSRLEGDTFLKYLMKLARHSSVSVRRMAIRAIGQASGDRTSEIFKFIDDPDASVRRIILAHMGQSKNEIAEDLLMQYLQNRQFKTSQTEHIMECFRTLGKCGSSRSVPFLRKILLYRKWMAALRKSTYREGAALALVTLKIPEAQQVIDAVSKSFNPGLRRIARNAEREFFQKTRGEL
ncbi:MAG: HEAT repeat domain-containing protein [Smithella sp.]